MYLPNKPLAALSRASRAMLQPATPLLAQMVVTRRCNLSCGYCNEYDDRSAPLPLDDLFRRIEHLAALGTLTVTLTGGEPLLHPDLHQLIARVTSYGMVCTTITNGYPVTLRWIDRLNRAGLSWLQISIDNLEPNDVSQKSLSKIKPKLALLTEHARFGVNVNAVLGSCTPDDARQLVREVEALGLYMSCTHIAARRCSTGRAKAGSTGCFEMAVRLGNAARALVTCTSTSGARSRIAVSVGANRGSICSTMERANCAAHSMRKKAARTHAPSPASGAPRHSMNCDLKPARSFRRSRADREPSRSTSSRRKRASNRPHRAQKCKCAIDRDVRSDAADATPQALN
jgi:molybdenum cofactor biosynthesis enzyme MoaA